MSNLTCITLAVAAPPMNPRLALVQEASTRQTECIAPNVLIHDPRRSAMMDLATGRAPTQQAHDLRNFLYLSSSFAQLMLEGLSGPVTPQQKELLGHIVDCMARAQKLLVPESASTAPAAQDSLPARRAFDA